jgi:flagellar FliJ protein
MKKKFKLQKVLEYRENILELEKKKLIELQNKLKDLEFKKEEIIKDIELKSSELSDLKLNADFKFIKMYEDFIEKLKLMLSQLNNMIVQTIKDIENQKKKVIEALNDKKIMEKLKDKHIENYNLYLHKEELKMVDDMVTSRFKGEYNE